MNYRFFLVEERVPFLVKVLGDKVTMDKTDDSGMVAVNVVIEDDFDLLQVFHAGIAVGMAPVVVAK